MDVRGVFPRLDLRGFSYGGPGEWAAGSRWADEAEQALAEFVPAWPEEGVGLGARWEVDRPVVREYAAATLHIVYELVGRDGEMVELRARASLGAERQYDDVANGVSEEVNELLGLTGEGEANLRVSLDGLPIATGVTSLSWTARIRLHRYSNELRSWSTVDRERRGSTTTHLEIIGSDP